MIIVDAKSLVITQDNNAQFCVLKLIVKEFRFRIEQLEKLIPFQGAEHTVDISSVIAIPSTSNFYCPSCFSPFLHDVLLSRAGVKNNFVLHAS